MRKIIEMSQLTEEEIRPAVIFDEYLRLVEADGQILFFLQPYLA